MLGTAVGRTAESIGGDKAFSFVALGDVPYNLPGDYAKLKSTLTLTND